MTRWVRRMWDWLGRARIEEELDEEVRTHLALAADEYTRRGMDPEAARAAARRSFGAVARMKDAHRGAVGKLIPAPLGELVVMTLDLRLLAFAVAAALWTGVAFGLFPFIRICGRNPKPSLGTRAAVGWSLRRRWVQAVLVSVEVALALVVVASSALMVRTIRNLEAVDPGFHAEDSFFSPSDLAVLTTRDPQALAASVKDAIWAVDSDQTVADMRTLDAIVGGQIADRKLQTALLASFSGLSLVLAALGVYGLLSFVVASRTNELGVRRAMGAQVGDVMALVFRDSLMWVLWGVAAGVALTLAVSQSMRGLLYGVEPLDGRSLITAVLLLGLTGVAASLVPAWHAARVDPVQALRYE